MSPAAERKEPWTRTEGASLDTGTPRFRARGDDIGHAFVSSQTHPENISDSGRRGAVNVVFFLVCSCRKKHKNQWVTAELSPKAEDIRGLFFMVLVLFEALPAGMSDADQTQIFFFVVFCTVLFLSSVHGCFRFSRPSKCVYVSIWMCMSACATKMGQGGGGRYSC